MNCRLNQSIQRVGARRLDQVELLQQQPLAPSVDARRCVEDLIWKKSRYR